MGFKPVVLKSGNYVTDLDAGNKKFVKTSVLLDTCSTSRICISHHALFFRQVFYGLDPGWIVSLSEKRIYKPKDKELDEYYRK